MKNPPRSLRRTFVVVLMRLFTFEAEANRIQTSFILFVCTLAMIAIGNSFLKNPYLNMVPVEDVVTIEGKVSDWTLDPFWVLDSVSPGDDNHVILRLEGSRDRFVIGPGGNAVSQDQFKRLTAANPRGSRLDLGVSKVNLQEAEDSRKSGEEADYIRVLRMKTDAVTIETPIKGTPGGEEDASNSRSVGLGLILVGLLLMIPAGIGVIRRFLEVRDRIE